MPCALLRRVALGAALCVVAPTLWALPKQYRLLDLGAGSLAVHLNDRGVVAGTDTSLGHHAPARWVGSQLQWLDNPYPEGDALWINASGVIVGADSAGYGSAAYWTSYGVFEDIGETLDLIGSAITSINDHGDCVIWGGVDADSWVLYLVPKCNISKRIQVGWDMVGAAINAYDQVALTQGASYDGSQHAYLYSDGVLTDPGLLQGYTQTVAADLNSHAHVVGTAADAAYDQRQAFFWNGKKLRPVGTLGGERSEAKAVDHADVVVGSAQSPNGTWRAFIRDMHATGSQPRDLTKMLDASGAGWSLQSAFSINKAGQIVVQGTAPGDTSLRSAVLTPIN